MIKSEIVKTPVEPTKPKYPYLARGEFDDHIFIVLFTDRREGMVVHIISSSHYGVGYYSSTWDEESFKPFMGKIVLQNA